jgi:hypothetical protein
MLNVIISVVALSVLIYVVYKISIRGYARHKAIKGSFANSASKEAFEKIRDNIGLHLLVTVLVVSIIGIAWGVTIDFATPAHIKEESARKYRESRQNSSAPDGMTKAEWSTRCLNYEAARKECAGSQSMNRCVEIKVGELAAGMAKIYCKNGEPDFNLMGIK